MFFKKKKNKHKIRNISTNAMNSRQKRKARQAISEAQKASIISAILSKKRLLVYTDSL